jgi:hypothetical protein
MQEDVTLAGYTRSRQILLLLKKYGPLSCRSILKIIEPPIEDRRMYDAVARLRQRNMIKARKKSYPEAPSYYQIRQDPWSRKRVADFLKCTNDDVCQKRYRFANADENSVIAMWWHAIQKQMPQLEIIRRYNFFEHETVHTLIPFHQGVPACPPDLILIAPKDENGRQKSVAVLFGGFGLDIDRFFHTLRTYKNKSKVDGVLLLLNEFEMEMFFDLHHREDLAPKLKLVKKYLNNNVSITDQRLILETHTPCVARHEKTVLTFSDWFNQLQLREQDETQDANSKTGG